MQGLKMKSLKNVEGRNEPNVGYPSKLIRTVNSTVDILLYKMTVNYYMKNVPMDHFHAFLSLLKLKSTKGLFV